MQNVRQWLDSLGLEQYADSFEENAIGLDLLDELADEDLQILGVAALGHRKRILKAVAEVSMPRSTKGSSPSRSVSETDEQSREAERRQLTVMFCDLVGSTALSESVDPEEYREVLGRYQESARQQVSLYDGYIARYMGDGLLVYFGYPQAHENDAERAVRAGLAIIDQVEALPAKGSDKLQVRIGIATGVVVAGDIVGEGASEERAVLGGTPNLAARLQALAAPGSVLVSEVTRSLAGAFFEYADAGSHPLKGFSDPVSVWHVQSVAEPRSRFDALRSPRLSPFVGRQPELALLEDRWQRAHDGEGQVVLLAGEAGIGKSRLALALSVRVEGATACPLWLQCSPHHANTAYFPYIQELARAAGLGDADRLPGAFAKLEKLIEAAGMTVPDTAPIYANALGLPIETSKAAVQLAPDEIRKLTAAAFNDRILGLAAKSPILVVVEDAHWIDPSSAEALGSLIDHIVDAAVLVVITHRPEFEPPWHDRSHVGTVTLGRLSRRQCTELVRRIAGANVIGDAMVSRIVGQTDGVPLFIEELSRTVLEVNERRGQSQPPGGHGPLTDFEVPATLRDLLLAQLDQLEPGAREVAQLGSCIGREFDYTSLAAASGRADTALNQALSALAESGLVSERGLPPHSTYRFKHALVQDAAHDSLLRKTRRQLHERIARHLEVRGTATGAVAPELIGHHFNEGGCLEEAADYWLLAGRKATERSANQEAVAHLKLGLSTLCRLPESGDRERRELDLQLALCGPLNMTAGYGSEETASTYARARELCERHGDTERLRSLLHGQGVNLLFRGRHRDAREVGRTLLRLSEEAQDVAGIVDAHRLLCFLAVFLGELADVQPSIQAVLDRYDPVLLRSIRFRHGLDPKVSVLCCQACHLWLVGYPDKAARASEQALAHARQLDHAGSLVQALAIGAAMMAAMAGDFRVAELRAKETVELAREHRFSLYLAWGSIIGGWAIGRRLGPDRGLPLLRDGLQRLETDRQRNFRPICLSLLADLQLEGNDLIAAKQTLDEAQHCIETADERMWEAEIARLRGLLALAMREDAAAQHRFDSAIRIAQSQGARSLELRASVNLARLWADSGRSREAIDLLVPICQWFDQGKVSTDLAAAKALLHALS